MSNGATPSWSSLQSQYGLTQQDITSLQNQGYSPASANTFLTGIVGGGTSLGGGTNQPLSVSDPGGLPLLQGPGGMSLSQVIQFAGALGGGGGGGGGGGQSNLGPNVNQSIVNNPLYSLSQLGAAALNSPMIVNPNPSQQPINQQGGVFSGPQNPMIGYIAGKPPALQGPNPTGPWMNTPGIFGGQAPIVPPTAQVPMQAGIQPTAPYGGVSGAPMRRAPGVPWATPPAAPSIQNSTAGITPTAGIMPPGAPGAGGPNPTRDGLIHPPTLGNFGANPTTPGTSLGSIALQNAGVQPPMKMQSGGKVPGDTDTVPAMLTPGEYVINKDAAQKLGRNTLEALNRVEQPAKSKKKNLGDGLFEHKQMGGEVGAGDETSAATDSAAYQWALNQLPAAEKAALSQQTVAGGGGVNPMMMRAQRDLQNLIQQYTSRASATKATPSPKAPSGEKTPQTTPSAMGGNQNAPQTGASASGPGAYWPAGSTVQPGQYVFGPSPGAGQSGPIIASGDQATQYPQAAQGGLSQQQGQALASGISSIGQSLAQAFQNNAKISWQNIPAGAWANPAAYESQEQRYYGQYEAPMSQLQIV